MNELRAYSKLFALAQGALLTALLGACASGAGELAPPDDVSLLRDEAPQGAAGHAVGTAHLVVDAAGGRKLPVQLWYPAAESARAEAAAGRPVYELEPAGPRREKLKTLLEGGNKDCTNLTAHAALDAAPREGADALPLIVVSHHFAGTRFSTFSINERLASLGFLVAAPDHVGMSLFDYEPSRPLDLTITLTAPFLQTRATDIKGVLDALLSATASGVPEALRGRVDADRIGMYGHSFGAMTTGIVAATDTRVKAAAYLAMVVTSPLLQLVQGTPAIARFRVPGLYLLAQEDKSAAGAGGAAQIRANFTQQKPPAWLVEVKDMGHFAFADDLAAIDGFADGCGKGTRVDTPAAAFTNIAPAEARAITARYTSAFFAHQFLGAPAAPLSEAVPPGIVVTRSRP